MSWSSIWNKKSKYKKPAINPKRLNGKERPLAHYFCYSVQCFTSLVEPLTKSVFGRFVDKEDLCVLAGIEVCVRHNRGPTGLFAILEPQNQDVGLFYVAQKRRPTEFEAPKL